MAELEEAGLGGRAERSKEKRAESELVGLHPKC